MSLSRAFLHAGAARVMATLWPVEDWATAAVMEAFYRALGSGSSPAWALAQAQRTALAASATAHPFHWSGVVLIEGSAVGTSR